MMKTRNVNRMWFTALIALVTMVGTSHARTCVLSPATTWYNSVNVGPYKLLFDDHDPPGPHGNAWVSDVAMRIQQPGGTSCLASPDVAIVSLPIYLASDHYMYISAYHTDYGYLFVVDGRNCRTIWQSPQLLGGHFYRTFSGFYAPGFGALVLGADCLPAQLFGKQVTLPAETP